MKTTSFRMLSACSTVLAVLLTIGPASAQLKAPDQPAVKKMEPTRKAEPTKKPLAKSACQGLDMAACSTRPAECHWIREADITKGPQKGSKRAAHCAKLPEKKAGKTAPSKGPADKKGPAEKK